MAYLAVLVVVGVLVLALLLLAASGNMRRRSGVPQGEIVQSDVQVGKRGKRLYSARYGLSGTPDYLVQTSGGLVPVELKPERDEDEPRESHLLQVLAYCLLVEETQGARPPYGLLRYRSGTFKVDYNAETKAHLLAVLDAMRLDLARAEVHRSHDSVGRCRACAYHTICDESLWEGN